MSMQLFLTRACRSVYDPEVIQAICKELSYDARHWRWEVRYQEFYQNLRIDEGVLARYGREERLRQCDVKCIITHAP